MAGKSGKAAAAVDPLLLELLADAGEPAGLAALADWLNDLGPTPVGRPQEIPNWLRLGWLAARRRDGIAHEAWFRRRLRGADAGPEPPRLRGPYIQSGQEVWQDINRWLGDQRAGWSLDHEGSTVVGGLTGFASEPYATLKDAQAQAALLAGRAGCVGVGLRESHHGSGTVRVLLLPRTAST
jgi:hypothetical protein